MARRKQSAETEEKFRLGEEVHLPWSKIIKRPWKLLTLYWLDFRLLHP